MFGVGLLAGCEMNRTVFLDVLVVGRMCDEQDSVLGCWGLGCWQDVR